MLSSNSSKFTTPQQKGYNLLLVTSRAFMTFIPFDEVNTIEAINDKLFDECVIRLMIIYIDLLIGIQLTYRSVVLLVTPTIWTYAIWAFTFSFILGFFEKID